MDNRALKERVFKTIDENRERIIEAGRAIFAHPELGYKEHFASELVQSVFSELGLPYQTGLGITGVKARAAGRDHRACVALLGELDAVVSPTHPFADERSGAAHACGHNAQIAAMLGAAMGLCLSGAMEQLDGDLAFLAVPAEEFVELEYRQKLRDEGRVEFVGGKQQLIAEGAFDDVDMAMMVHSYCSPNVRSSVVGAPSSGFVGKIVQYTGKEAHAGVEPENGVNALNAAMLGLMAINAQRETFKDDDGIRVHPIITKGGDLVNIVPADVRIETYVRGMDTDAVVAASAKVNRALEAGAYAVGARCEIKELPGYLPMRQNPDLDRVFLKNARALLWEEQVIDATVGPKMGAGSSDMGDLSHVIPAIHPVAGGFCGNAHAKDFAICDEEMAYILPAKMMAATAVDLLWDGAAEALRVKENFVPKYTKESYLQFWRAFVGE